MSLRTVALCVVLIASGCVALNAQSCPAVDQRLTSARRAKYAPLIEAKAGGASLGHPVKLQSLMRVGSWTAVFAVPYNAERGVFFFEAREGKIITHDVWGGVAAGDSVAIIADSEKLIDPNIPRALSLCVARAVVDGR